MTVGEKIKIRRTEKNLKQRDLAVLVSVLNESCKQKSSPFLQKAKIFFVDKKGYGKQNGRLTIFEKSRPKRFAY